MALTRELHDRISVCAALYGYRIAGEYVADLLEQVIPVFAVGTPIAELARLARQVAPHSQGQERFLAMRMRVMLSEALYRRVHQLAKLRGQTMKASLMDLLEVHVSEA